MHYQFQFSVYQRPFKIPLRTHHGLWQTREGIILTFRDELGQITQGEIAPLPWFGTETLDQAIALCSSFQNSITTTQIQQISDQFPACQFGFETGVFRYQTSDIRYQLGNKECCQLLPRSGDIFQQLKGSINQGFRTFKLKIAVDQIQAEIEFCQRVIDFLPNHCKLRLDANGGLSLEQAKQWLEWGEKQKKLEFIEQPLPPENFDQLLGLQQDFYTAIALDESVSTIQQLQTCYEKGWRGIFVGKVAIAGFPSRLKTFCQDKNLDLVFSTVFETEIGRQAVLNIATKLGDRQRALGMGGSHWFTDTCNPS